jgi:hypothetical protein
MTRSPLYSPEEFARRGREIYEHALRPLVEPGNKGRIIAIDIESKAYEIDDNVISATDRLFARVPTAQPWIVKIGYPAVHHFGPRVNIPVK